MKIRPLYDRIVVRREEEETTTAGGIVLPGEGKVLDNGEIRPLAVKVGDKVIFGKYAGSNTIKVDDEELLILSESEIYGVIEG